MTAQVKQITARDLGCVIDASHLSADNINARTVNFAREFGYDPGDVPEDPEGYSEWLSEAGDEAVDHLNSLDLPAYCSFFFEDNSLFLMPNLDSVKEDVQFVSSKEQDYPAEGSQRARPCCRAGDEITLCLD